jgi:MSHA pilin protein MshD
LIPRLNLTYLPHRVKQLGVSLVELILTIVIISVALTGILSVVNQAVSHSADPLLQRQAIAIAESYLEEIILLPVTASPDVSVAGNRATFDNIADYDGLNDTGAIDQNGNAIVGLESYNIAVNVNAVIINNVNMQKIIVTVSRPATDTITLTGYRANY